jgi:hypothetical protein
MKKLIFVPLALVTMAAGAVTRLVQDQCGPFTDVSPSICPYVLEMYYLGVTAGTTPTTFSPDNTVTRGQAAVFVSKAVNQSLARSRRRAALGQWGKSSYLTWSSGVGVVPLDGLTGQLTSDGENVWAVGSSGIYRVRASDGVLVDTWPITTGAVSPLIVLGRLFFAGSPTLNTWNLYMIDPTQPPGPPVNVAALPPNGPSALVFDGFSIWAANGGNSLEVVSLYGPMPWPVANYSMGFTAPSNMVFDGSNMWVLDSGKLLKVNSSGSILQTVNVSPNFFGPMVFDGSNVIVGNYVFRAADGQLLTSMNIGFPTQIAFDGERLLFMSCCSQDGTALTLMRAADFSIIQQDNFSGLGPPYAFGVVSDGVGFWAAAVPDSGGTALARY